MTSLASTWERRLERENLRHLDYPDGAGGITVANRGSGKLLDAERAFARTSAIAEREQRAAILAGHKFRRGERRLYALYAEGMSFREIERRTGVGYVSVYRRIARINQEHRAAAPLMPLAELFADCEPSTIVLVFALLERALTAPNEVRGLIGQARDVPELRALLEPDEMGGADG